MTVVETIDHLLAAAHDRWLHAVWIGDDAQEKIANAQLDRLLEQRWRITAHAA